MVELQRWTEVPMLVLGLAWVGLLVYELTVGLSPLMERAGLLIWGIFIVDFGLKLLLAPDKSLYLRKNWLTAVALLLPALRVLRIFQALRILRLARVARGLRLARVVTSLNRGVGVVGHLLSRRGVGFVALLTVLVVLVSAAAMMSFETGSPRFLTLGESVWWTTMLVLTIGSSEGPTSTEGRLLTALLALYGFSILGFVTATLASYLLEGSDSAKTDRVIEEIRLLRKEIEEL
ncbi:MAG TPA: ion transporter, partial [Fimbriimonas sp.]